MGEQRKYNREFKLNAVKLYQEGGKPLELLAKDLGLPMTTLASWVKQFKEYGNDSFPGKGVLNSQNEELYRLKRELSDVKQERDILKKAVAIFSRVKR